MTTNKYFNHYLFPYVLIFFSTIVVFIVILANPGYYSHDELQKLDFINRYGFQQYLHEYVSIKVGNEFGTPVRPFSFMIQGIQALFMDHYPVIVHLIDVLSHAIVAMLFYTLILQFSGTKRLSLLASIIFIVNPMTTLSVGWPAALMDRYYILFGLITLLAADRYIRFEQKKIYLFVVFFGASLSILSKETALILPALISLPLAIKFCYIKTKRFWIILSVWMLPILSFFIYRLPALINSFHNPHITAYKASVTNIPEGLFIYVSYPFIVNLTEAVNWVFTETIWIWVGVILHIVILIAIFANYGFKFIAYYILLFFLFLLPVLLIPIKSAHYLYGSSLVFSLALASIILFQGKYKNINKIFGLSVLLIMVVHTYFLQAFVYRLGSCMNTALTTTKAVYYSNGSPESVNFQAEASAPEHVLYRITTGRDTIGDKSQIKLTVSKWNTKVDPNELLLMMTPECVMYSKKVEK